MGNVAWRDTAKYRTAGVGGLTGTSLGRSMETEAEEQAERKKVGIYLPVPLVSPTAILSFLPRLRKKVDVLQVTSNSLPRGVWVGWVGGALEETFSGLPTSPALKKRDGKREDKRETVDGTETV